MAILPLSFGGAGGASYRPLFSSNPLQAHPLHFALTALLFFACIGLYNRDPYPTRIDFISNGAGTSRELTLSQRLQRSEDAFQRSIASRAYLYQQYGKDPESFPSEPPYPAMTVWDFSYPSFNCPFEFERIGCAGDGGKWTCGLSRLAEQKEVVVYSFGINGESSFEEEILKRVPGSQVWGYDFSVKSFGPQISRSHASRTHFFSQGLSGTDDPSGDPPMYTLEHLMQINGHDFIDVLKVDIETSEFDVLDDVIAAYQGRPLPFGQLLIEIHAWKWQKPKVSTMVPWLENLEKAGLRPFMSEPNLVAANYHGLPQLAEYSFINVRGKHALIADM